MHGVIAGENMVDQVCGIGWRGCRRGDIQCLQFTFQVFDGQATLGGSLFQADAATAAEI